MCQGSGKMETLKIYLDGVAYVLDAAPPFLVKKLLVVFLQVVLTSIAFYLRSFTKTIVILFIIVKTLSLIIYIIKESTNIQLYKLKIFYV